MIPRRAFYLPNQTLIVSKFDPVAVALLNEVIAKTGAKLVISSTWRKHGVEIVKPTLEENGISWKHVHADWMTTCKHDTRTGEIKSWLAKHPKVTHWAALDDEKLDLDGHSVKVSFEDGLLMEHYHKLLELLVVVEDDATEDARHVARQSKKPTVAVVHVQRIIENTEEKA